MLQLFIQIILAQNDSTFIQFSLPKNSEFIQNGRKEYNSLLDKRNTPTYGKCWEEALSKLGDNCDHLDEYRQSWLAISFTYCFLLPLGKQLNNEFCLQVVKWNYQDQDSHSFNSMITKIKECAKGMIELNLFDTYTLFFVHTQSICFYLQSEKWQQNTENLVNKLVRVARTVSNDLNSAVHQIHHLEQLQHSSLEAQISINQELNQAKVNLDNFQKQNKAQQDLIEKIITQFNKLQDFLVSEFSTNSSIIFYISVMVVIYFFTTPQRTISIRPILFLIMICCFFFEKNGLEYLINFYYFLNLHLYNHEIYSSNLNISIDINTKIWMLRRCMCLTQALIYVWRLLTYTDLAEINYQLLNKNTHLLENIQHQLDRSYDHSFKEHCNDSNDSSDSLSDYESDESFDFKNDTFSEEYSFNKCYNLRPRKNLDFFPKQYQNESVEEFLNNIGYTNKKK